MARDQVPLGMADIGAESALIAAGGRAILLQIADPQVGRGVVDHSDFASRPFDRLRNTLTYVYAIVYGTPEHIRLVRARVNAAHAPVQRSDPDRSYNAFSGESQLWVAATLYESAVRMYELVHGQLDAASADRIYTEYAALGTALQMPAELWPADRAAFSEYWDAKIATLEVDRDVREVAKQLLAAEAAPLWIRSGMPLARLITVGLLPPSLRDAYGLVWHDQRQRSYARAIRTIRVLYPRVPRLIRTLPRTVLLRSLSRS